MLQEISNLDNKNKRKKISTRTIILWTGQQLSLLGSTLTSFVLLWWVSEITHSELILGIATLMIFIPYLMVAPLSGILIDKINRKKMLFIVDFLQAIFTTILIVIFYYFKKIQSTDSVILLISVIIILGLRGIMQVFHEITITSIIPFLVDEEYISRFNSIIFLGGGIARIAGVLLLNFIPIEYILWFDVITFIITIVPLLYSKIPNNNLEKENKTSFINQFREGLITIKEIKGLFATILLVPIVNFFFSPMMSLLPLFISKIHHGSENQYAIAIILWQIGIIASSIFMCFFKGFKNKIKTAVISICFLFFIQSLVIFIPTTLEMRFWLIGIILFCSMIFNPIANVSFYAAIQIIIPKEKLGRVISTVFFIANAITPIGIFLSGLIGEYISLNWLFVSSGILGLISILIVYFFTGSKNLDRIIVKNCNKTNNESEFVLENENEMEL
ncbi:MAG TPA: MFS transporter [Candidatus Bathyarchaeia archaeon]|nr:MFS transporter [Candidatus Bathyarchaeia archaeon]